MRPSLFLITGATGKTGGAFARLLLRKKQPVRVFARSEEKARPLAAMGAEVCIGDLCDAASVTKAMQGVRILFHAGPSDQGRDPAETEKTIGRNVVEAARAAKVEQVVYLSVMWADRKTGIPHFETKTVIEGWIRESGIPWTFLRPNYFMDNLLPLKDAILSGVLPYPLPPERRLSMVAVKDIALTAERVCELRMTGETFDLVGPRPVIMPEAARAFSRALQREVLFQPLSVAEWAEQVKPLLPARVIRDLSLMWNYYRKVDFMGDPTPLQTRLSIPLTTIEEFAREATRGWTASEGVRSQPL